MRSFALAVVLLSLSSLCASADDERESRRTEGVEGDEALFTAVGEGDVAKVNELLKLGSTVASRNKWGETAMHLAGISGDVKMVKALVAAGGDVNAVTHGVYPGHKLPVQRTPLMWMVYTRGVGTAPTKALLDAGARVSPKNEEGKTVVDLVRDMKAASADVDDLLDMLVAQEKREVAEAAGEL